LLWSFSPIFLITNSIPKHRGIIKIIPIRNADKIKYKPSIKPLNIPSVFGKGNNWIPQMQAVILSMTASNETSPDLRNDSVIFFKQIARAAYITRRENNDKPIIRPELSPRYFS
jgi:hypothetical protein